MAVHGFPLAIQLFAFRSIPLLLQYLPHVEDQSTFLHQTLTHLPKCKSFHYSNILSVENDPSVFRLVKPFGVVVMAPYLHCTLPANGNKELQLVAPLILNLLKCHHRGSVQSPSLSKLQKM
ncbi:hypothetical protein ARALYDRAFT_338603 [Arabidopsis lyrata subsp. lyrata]|uniref:Uncharacterized protein n=1 Tax=Arabidopsis lyrata subsp. lyrata TaxID=81972 RepID=D7KZ62_ARALL|nr:hypothetical protein ARALYDRAFT_338603 [Arabidopsis lyrata subsp. lyrata]